MENQPKAQGCMISVPCRYVLVGQVFVGMMCFYAIRSVLSLSLVAMVTSPENDDHVDHNATNVTTRKDECPGNLDDNSTTYSSNEFDWSPKTQGIILGSFYYGYVCTQIIGGRLADAMGPKLMIGGGVAVCSILTIVSPFAARWSVWVLFAVRFLTGILQGGVVPGVNTLFTRWCGPNEHSRMMGLTFTGMEVGSIVTMPLTGYLCTYGFGGGWPSAFYVFGMAGLLWSVVWFFFAFDSPEMHPRISQEEKQLILSATVSKHSRGIKELTSLPLRAMLTSMPVWALVVALSTSSFGFYYIQTELPSYLTNVLKMSLLQNGYILSITFASCAVSTVGWAFLADFIIVRGYASTNTTRKSLEVMGLIGSAAVLVTVTFLGCDSLAVIMCLNISAIMLEMTNAADGTMAIEVAPNFAGTLYGMANTGGSIAGILAPLVTGIFVDADSHSLTKWSYAFYTAAAVQCTGALFFLIFGSTERQKWDEDNDKETFWESCSVSSNADLY